MVLEDIEIAKKIFEVLRSGIVPDYDSFEFCAVLQPGYIEIRLSIVSNGTKSSSVETNFNGAILCDLIDELTASGARRGDHWKSFTMAYDVGGKVKTNFAY